MPLRPDLAKTLTDSLAGKRVGLDVSVLLAGLLDPDSPSARLLGVATHAVIVVSSHVEERARAVLRAAGPHLIPAFNDGLLRLGVSHSVERVTPDGTEAVPTWAESALSAEDRNVLVGALAGRCNWLFTHDREFFGGPIPGMAPFAPAAFVWDALDAANIVPGNHGFTFLGTFYPGWGSDVVRGSDSLFYLFDIDNYLWAFYSAKHGSFRVGWHRKAGSKSGIALRQEVKMQSDNFVAVTVAEDHVTLFANGQAQSQQVALGRIPANVRFHPFMSRESLHQINGGCMWRVASTALTAKTVPRHWKARSICLTDGELRFADWAARSSLILPAQSSEIIVRPT